MTVPFAPGFSSDIVESSGDDDDRPTVTFAALANSRGINSIVKRLMNDRARPYQGQLPNGIPNDVADRMSRGGR
jgi:hypothetical protein